eukprot:CAMPEP_0174368012 /NCGR_PEP_ID=MMETSP0811_2-20130205/87477_1 /TAXON_ID=73025 ORGANISM="Eutreptiella gymnastica-like, Strain CCMP1594" /NCGR_SAMPLE_ID=MMETSP0811_2 /ASSEMBLY_ACC=CAM_ASM_000667 /LENGTH=47 /DNA_ID= /DNA_START= /DNA_END= /DNA_ORIENTATION=
MSNNEEGVKRGWPMHGEIVVAHYDQATQSGDGMPYAMQDRREVALQP